MQYEVDTYKLEYDEEKHLYHIIFRDSIGKECKLEINEKIFNVYMLSKKEYKKIANQYDRHEEKYIRDAFKINKKALIHEESVENIVIKNLARTALRRAVKDIHAPHNRRLEMYLFKEMSTQEIAKKENRNERTIRYSISKGMSEIIKKLKNF